MNTSWILFFIFTFSCLLLSAQNTQEDSAPLPLFQAGIFIGHGVLPDYPASDQSHSWTIPVPLVRYRGEIFRSEEHEGTRFRFFKNKEFDIDFSFGGSFPTNTKENRARLDMPALDWTLEVGPRLLCYLYKNKSGYARFGLPFRLSYATNFTKWSQAGSIWAPSVQIDRYGVLDPNLDLFFIVNFNFLDRSLSHYFFGIDPQYSNTERINYDAKAGFLGYDISVASKYSWSDKSVIAAVRYADYGASQNRASYLHRTPINWSFFVAYSWLFYESEERSLD